MIEIFLHDATIGAKTMGHPLLDQRKKDYLASQYSLDRESLDALLEDITGFLSETPREFIVRRHRELQEKNWPNTMIFSRIGEELGRGLFRSEKFTERQIRRQIYG